MPLTDFAKQWKEKNQGLFKYAGDVAKNSVDKGLKEAHDYMQDADEGTSFEDVQTASVKRHLANDANDDKLYNAAMMELIGHLSKDNKETYLKHTQPLQKYIDVKDEFDFKHNNYTTTENVDTTPDENVRNLQRELNEAGYTDKFGQKLKEDGIYAGKTAYADDSKKADVENNNNSNVETYSTDTFFVNNNVEEQNYDEENTSQRFGNRWNAPVRTGERPGERETSTDRQDAESDSNENTYINDNGIVKWKELPYIAQRLPVETKLFREKKISTEVYNAFDTLSQKWYYANTAEAREEISAIAQKVRDNGYKIDDCTKVANQELWNNAQEIYNVLLNEKDDIADKVLYLLKKKVEPFSSAVSDISENAIKWLIRVYKNGKWDYKSTEVHTEWMPETRYFMYYGEIIDAAAFGNINFGYTGTTLGIDAETLYKGGGTLANNPTEYEISHYYSDSEVDHYYIKIGIEQANKEGYYGQLHFPDGFFDIMKDVIEIIKK